MAIAGYHDSNGCQPEQERARWRRPDDGFFEQQLNTSANGCPAPGIQNRLTPFGVPKRALYPTEMIFASASV